MIDVHHHIVSSSQIETHIDSCGIARQNSKNTSYLGAGQMTGAKHSFDKANTFDCTSHVRSNPQFLDGYRTTALQPTRAMIKPSNLERLNEIDYSQQLTRSETSSCCVERFVKCMHVHLLWFQIPRQHLRD